MTRMDVSIVIPCLNERATIRSAVNDAKSWVKSSFGEKCEVIVADNGSTDGTLKILKTLKGVRVVSVPVRGYGAALHWGIMSARNKYVIFADADLSYPFFNIVNFKDALRNNPDLVLGSRFEGKIESGAMPFLHRYIGTPVLTWLIRFIYHIPTSDCNSGMRMVNKDFYKTLNMRNSGMEWASELLLKTAIKKGKYVEVPIIFLKDKRKGRPHLSTWSDGWRHLKAILLLKPDTFLFFTVLFVITAIVFIETSFGFTSLFLLLSVALVYSYMALKFMTFAIEKTSNKISQVLNSHFFVPVMIIKLILSAVIIYLLPDAHLGTKILLAGIDAITVIWVFLIETIKTHLINRLPDDYFK